MRYVIPHAAGFLLPALVFALVYATQGENPAWGAVAGVIGLFGSLAADLVRIPMARRWAERDEREHWETVVREQREKEERHEGTDRLHRDVANDESFRSEEK